MQIVIYMLTFTSCFGSDLSWWEMHTRVLVSHVATSLNVFTSMMTHTCRDV